MECSNDVPIPPRRARRGDAIPTPPFHYSEKKATKNVDSDVELARRKPMPKSPLAIPIAELKGTPEFALIAGHLDVLDQDKNGLIDATELVAFLEQSENLEKSVRQYKEGIIGVFIFIIILILANFGLCYLALKIEKQIHSDPNTSLVNNEGELLYVGTAEESSGLVSVDYFFDEFTNEESLSVSKIIFTEVPDGTILRYDIANVHILDDSVQFVTSHSETLTFESRTFPFNAQEMEVFMITEY